MPPTIAIPDATGRPRQYDLAAMQRFEVHDDRHLPGVTLIAAYLCRERGCVVLHRHSTLSDPSGPGGIVGETWAAHAPEDCDYELSLRVLIRRCTRTGGDLTAFVEALRGLLNRKGADA